jgi:hypothetical protein
MGRPLGVPSLRQNQMLPQQKGRSLPATLMMCGSLTSLRKYKKVNVNEDGAPTRQLQLKPQATTPCNKYP